MKKLLAILLALTMALSLCAVCAFADDEDGSVAATDITFYSEGDVVTALPRGASKDISVLIDGDAVSAASAHTTTGVVLFMNTHCTNAGEYPEMSLTVELEKVANVTGATLSLYEEPSAMICTPKDGIVTVEYSVDGSDFNYLGEFEIGCTDACADYAAGTSKTQVETCEVSFDTIVDAKFVKFTFAFGDTPWETDGKVIAEFLGFTEISVKAEEGNTVVDDSSAPAEESKSDTKPSTETKNAAAGKSYVVDGAHGESYLDNGSKLTDGVLPETASYTDSAIVGLNAQTDFYTANGFAQVTIDLGAATKLNGFATYISNLGSAGVDAASSIIYEYSVDGTNFTELGEGTYDIDIATVKDVTAKNTLTLDSEVSARYVRVKFVKSSGVWMMISEIEAYTAVSGGKTDTSDGGKTEPTSDSGILALAVVASLAAAGAVIIKKSR